MNDTDKMIAGMFASAMIARQAEPKIEDFLGHFEVCIDGLIKREAVEAEAKLERTILAHKKAWG
jgi:hypothetical protein